VDNALVPKSGHARTIQIKGRNTTKSVRPRTNKKMSAREKGGANDVIPFLAADYLKATRHGIQVNKALRVTEKWS